MNTKYMRATLGLGLLLVVGQARAETEGSGEPFPFHVGGQTYASAPALTGKAMIISGQQTAGPATTVSPLRAVNKAAIVSAPAAKSIF